MKYLPTLRCFLSKWNCQRLLSKFLKYRHPDHFTNKQTKSCQDIMKSGMVFFIYLNVIRFTTWGATEKYLKEHGWTQNLNWICPLKITQTDATIITKSVQHCLWLTYVYLQRKHRSLYMLVSFLKKKKKEIRPDLHYILRMTTFRQLYRSPINYLQSVSMLQTL